MAQMPAGIVLTDTYQKILDEGDFHVTTEFIYYGAGKAFLIFGDQTLSDEHAIEISASAGYYTMSPITTDVYAKGQGKIVVVANNNKIT